MSLAEHTETPVGMPVSANTPGLHQGDSVGLELAPGGRSKGDLALLFYPSNCRFTVQ
jgi:hypothetical protein